MNRSQRTHMGCQQEAPYVPSLLVKFRKRLTDEVLGEINEMIISHNHPDDSGPGGTPGGLFYDDTSPEESGTKPYSETMMLDATCAPQYIECPQDINLSNKARENLEEIIVMICYEYNEPRLRTYRVNARKDYLALAKRKKCSGKQIQKAIKKQLQYIRRDLGYFDRFLADGKTHSKKHEKRLAVIWIVYEQQKYMYENC